MAFFINGRRIVYTNEVPFETDVLATNDYNMAASGALAEAMIGFGINNATTVSGLPCTPVAPPGLSVVVGAGSMFSYEFYDSTPYGVIPADTDPNHRLYKTAKNNDPVTLPLIAPPTPGDSVIYLIEGIFDTVDVNDVSRPYFNSADPTMPIFLNNFDTRTDIVLLQAKQGIPSITPAPPAPDAGYTGLYYVTVANGQTVIAPGDIVKVSTVEGQPFITEGLTQKVSSGAIAGSYVSIPAEQRGTYIYGNDVGAVDALAVNPANAYPAYVPGMHIDVLIANTNTGAATLNISANGATNVQVLSNAGLINLSGGELIAGSIAKLQYNGSVFQLLNPAKNKLYYGKVSFGAATTQIIPNAVWTKILFDDVYDDANGWWDAGNHRWVPNLKGKYRLAEAVSGYVAIPAQSFIVAAYKNGVISQMFGGLPYGDGGTSIGTSIISMNGTTDYLELFIVTQAGGNTIGNAFLSYPAGLNGTNQNLFEIEYIGT